MAIGVFWEALVPAGRGFWGISLALKVFLAVGPCRHSADTFGRKRFFSRYVVPKYVLCEDFEFCPWIMETILSKPYAQSGIRSQKDTGSRPDHLNTKS